MNLVGHPASSSVQLGGCSGRIEVAQIIYFDFITQRAIKDLLETLRQNNSSKHLVAVDYSLQGRLETLHIQIFYVHFGIAVTGNISKLNSFRSAHQIGLLKIGQRKWFKAIRQIRMNRDKRRSFFRGRFPPELRQTPRELRAFLRGKKIYLTCCAQGLLTSIR